MRVRGKVRGGLGLGLASWTTSPTCSNQVASTIALVRALFGDFSFEEISENSRGYLNQVRVRVRLRARARVRLTLTLTLTRSSS